jgi:hypothetical protein
MNHQLATARGQNAQGPAGLDLYVHENIERCRDGIGRDRIFFSIWAIVN